MLTKQYARIIMLFCCIITHKSKRLLKNINYFCRANFTNVKEYATNRDVVINSLCSNAAQHCHNASCGREMVG